MDCILSSDPPTGPQRYRLMPLELRDASRVAAHHGYQGPIQTPCRYLCLLISKSTDGPQQKDLVDMSRRHFYDHKCFPVKSRRTGGPQAVGLALVFRFTDAECADKGHCIPPSPSRDRPTRDYYVCLNPVETIRFMLTVSSLIDFTGTFLCLGAPEYMMCILRPLNPSQSRYLLLTGSPLIIPSL